MISSCAWKSKTSKRDHPNQATPTIGIGRIRETRSLPTLETFSGSRLKTIKKALIPKISLKNLPILHLNPVRETLAQIIKVAGGGGRERGHGRGRNQQGEKRSGSAFSTRRTMTTTQITTPIKKGFEAILEEEKKQKERVVPINHTAPAWQNAPMAEAISPILYNNLHFPRPPQTFSQPPSWQSQTFQAQNVEQKPPEHFPPTPPPPPYKGPTAPPLPPKAEGQSNPLPSVGTILPIWGDLP